MTHTEELLQAKAREKQAVEREMDLTYRLYLDEQITSEGFGVRYSPLEERLAAINASIPALQGTIDAMTISHASTATVVSDAQTLYASWDHLNFDEKRSVITTIVERITIGETTVDIDLAYAPEKTKPPPTPQNPPLSPQTVVKGVRIPVPAATSPIPCASASALPPTSNATSPKSPGRSSTASTSTSR